MAKGHTSHIFIVLWPGLCGQMQPSPLKKSMSVIPPGSQACLSEWVTQDDIGGRQSFILTDHAPLSPQSSVASSGSEQTEEQGSSRNTFQEDGSGMKGQSSLPNEAKGAHGILLWNELSVASNCGGRSQTVILPYLCPVVSNCSRCPRLVEESPPS